MRARFYSKTRVFDENTGVRVKPDVSEYPLGISTDTVIFKFVYRPADISSIPRRLDSAELYQLFGTHMLKHNCS